MQLWRLTLFTVKIRCYIKDERAVVMVFDLLVLVQVNAIAGWVIVDAYLQCRGTVAINV